MKTVNRFGTNFINFLINELIIINLKTKVILFYLNLLIAQMPYTNLKEIKKARDHFDLLVVDSLFIEQLIIKFPNLERCIT